MNTRFCLLSKILCLLTLTGVIGAITNIFILLIAEERGETYNGKLFFRLTLLSSFLCAAACVAFMIRQTFQCHFGLNLLVALPVGTLFTILIKETFRPIRGT